MRTIPILTLSNKMRWSFIFGMLANVCLMPCAVVSKVEAGGLNNEQELNLVFDKAWYKKTKAIQINGMFSIFVNCGSQYALWHQFPAGIQYTLTDLNSGKEYVSVNRELSISWDGNQVYESYAKEPCNKIISQHFSVILSDIYFQDSPKKNVSRFKLHAEYAGHSSNVLIFDGIPFYINGY